MDNHFQYNCNNNCSQCIRDLKDISIKSVSIYNDKKLPLKLYINQLKQKDNKDA